MIRNRQLMYSLLIKMIFTFIFILLLTKDNFFQWYNTSLVVGIYIIGLLFFTKSLKEFVKKSLSQQSLMKFSTYIYILISYFILFFSIIILYDMPITTTIDILTSPSKKYFNSTDFQVFLFIMGTGIITPIWEEILFKGILLNYLIHRSNKIIAVIVVTFIFPLLHFSGLKLGVENDLVIIYLVGLLTTLIFLKTKSVWPAIILHIIYNIFSIYYWNYI